MGPSDEARGGAGARRSAVPGRSTEATVIEAHPVSAVAGGGLLLLLRLPLLWREWSTAGAGPPAVSEYRGIVTVVTGGGVRALLQSRLQPLDGGDQGRNHAVQRRQTLNVPRRG